MGAVISALVSKYRARRQPIYYTKEIFDLIWDSPSISPLTANLQFTLPESTETLSLSTLSVIRIRIENSGNEEIDNYKFGLTFGEHCRVLHVAPSSNDRHHELRLITPVTPYEPNKIVDLEAIPLNPKDDYYVDIFFTYSGEIGNISISSGHPAHLVERPHAPQGRRDKLISLLLLSGVAIFGIGGLFMAARSNAKTIKVQRELEEVQHKLEETQKDREILMKSLPDLIRRQLEGNEPKPVTK